MHPTPATVGTFFFLFRWRSRVSATRSGLGVVALLRRGAVGGGRLGLRVVIGPLWRRSRTVSVRPAPVGLQSLSCSVCAVAARESLVAWC